MVITSEQPSHSKSKVNQCGQNSREVPANLENNKVLAKDTWPSE